MDDGVEVQSFGEVSDVLMRFLLISYWKNDVAECYCGKQTKF